jgi:hypothetical protein
VIPCVCPKLGLYRHFYPIPALVKWLSSNFHTF